jgi:hypothetical protein
MPRAGDGDHLRREVQAKGIHPQFVKMGCDSPWAAAEIRHPVSRPARPHELGERREHGAIVRFCRELALQ